MAYSIPRDVFLLNELRSESAIKQFVRAKISEVRAEQKTSCFVVKDIERDDRFWVDVI